MARRGSQADRAGCRTAVTDTANRGVDTPAIQSSTTTTFTTGDDRPPCQTFYTSSSHCQISRPGRLYVGEGRGGDEGQATWSCNPKRVTTHNYKNDTGRTTSDSIKAADDVLLSTMRRFDELLSPSEVDIQLEELGRCTSAKARLISAAIRIRIRDPDRHQNLIIYSLEISWKSVRKFLRKAANRQTNKQTTNNDD